MFFKLILLSIVFITSGISKSLTKPFITSSHEGLIMSIEKSLDNKYLFSADSKGIIKIWDMKTSKELKTLMGHTDSINQIKITNDNKYLLSASEDKTVKLWSITTGKLIKTFNLNSRVYSIAITPDRKYVFAGGWDKLIKQINIATGKIVKKFKGHSGEITTLKIISNGKKILSVSKSITSDNTIKLWDIDSGKILKVFKYDSNKGSIFDVTNDEKYLILSTGDTDNNLQILDIKTGQTIKKLKGHKNGVKSILTTTDQNYILSSSCENLICEKSIKLWDIKTGKKIKDYKAANGSILLLGKDDKSFISTVSNKLLNEYEITTGNLIKTYIKNISTINTIDITNDDKYIIYGGSGKSLKYWDLKNGKLIRILNGHKREISSVVMSKDANYAFSSGNSWGGKIIQWDISLGKIIRSFKQENTTSLSIDSSGKYLVSGIANWKNNLNLWDISQGKIIKVLKGHNKHVNTVGISYNNQYILSGSSDKTFKLWDFHTGKLLKSLNQHKYTILKASISNEKYAVTTERVMVVLWNIKTGKKILTIKNGKNYFNSAVITKDNKYIIVGINNEPLKLFSIKDNSYINTFNERLSSINTLKLSNNGKYVISGTNNGLLKLWNIRQGKLIANFITFESGDWLVMTPEGYFNGSKNATKYVNMTKTTKDGLEPFDFSQLYDHFFRPDLVKLKLAGEDISKYTNGLTYQDALSNPPPKLAFKSIDSKEVKTSGFSYDDVKVSKEKVRLSFNVNEHDNGGIGLIRVYQEGKLIQIIGKGKVNKQSANVATILEQEKADKIVKANQELLNKKENESLLLASLSKSINSDLNMSVEDTVAKVQTSDVINNSGTYDLEIELKSGKNEISIEAFNKTNTVTSYRENITINADIPKYKPKLYAIVAGVNEFEHNNKKYQLKYSQNDAKAIKEAAEKKMGTVFEDVEVKYLIGKDVTKANILKEAQKISKKAKLDDTVLFYISTHGCAYKGKLYLVPYNNKSVANWIDFEQTFQAVQSIKALNQVFVIDACESGKANDIVSSVYDSRASVLAKSSGVHMLLATTKGSFAFEHPDPTIKNGVFTHRILEAMKDKDTDKNKDSFISILELSKKLKEPSSNTDYQYPVIRNIGSDLWIKKVR